MLNAIREFFEQHVAAEAGDDAHAVRLATAALLVETVRLDGGIDDAERAAAHRALRSKFALGAAEAATLIALAEEQARGATDYYQFTSLINRHFSAAQKEKVIELMWQVAYADADLSAHEQHVVRKIADLLHVPHRAYIAAKLRARDAAGG
ncbi:MAG TPA: TerB family tellurite resistance protein [Burkholderiales bacterium]|nr:TerB family tellurite resistance protein [Burkholderiales bacterium]